MTCHYPDLGSDKSSVWNFCACLVEYRLLNASKFMSSQRIIFCHCCFVFSFFCFVLFALWGSVIHAIFPLKYFIYWLCLVSWPLLSAMHYFVYHRLCMISAWSQTVPLVNINEIHIQTPKGGAAAPFLPPLTTSKSTQAMEGWSST